MKISRILFLLLINYTVINSYAQQYTPYTMGYLNIDTVISNDGKYVLSGGNYIGGSNIKKVSADAPPISWYHGFNKNITYLDPIFNKDKELFVSKGYFPDYVEMKWEIVNYESQIKRIKILRRLFGSSGDFEEVANLSKDDRLWRDDRSEAGVHYEYKIFADTDVFSKEISGINTITGIGFRMPFGSISGSVNFKQGGALEGASVTAKKINNPDDPMKAGYGLQLNGSNQYLSIPANDEGLFKLDTAFTFQGWFKPSIKNQDAVLMAKGSQYKITYNNGEIAFAYTTTSGTDTVHVTLPFQNDRYFNVTAVKSVDSVSLYAFYKSDSLEINIRKAITENTVASNSNIIIGKSNGDTKYFNGQIDELRIWYRSLDSAEVLKSTKKFLRGTEFGLIGYYRLNEGIGSKIYDLSRRGFSFNQNDGNINNDAVWTENIPEVEQIGYTGITDKNGYYSIEGIPFGTDGSSFDISPRYGVHEFEPSVVTRSLNEYNSQIQNLNFIDLDAFNFTGAVYYANTQYPVENVNVRVDGKLAFDANGSLITTGPDGIFVVEVAKGKHVIELEKNGHTFVNGGRFPAEANEEYDFQKHVDLSTSNPFYDSTLVKVVGKVVGGPREAEKPIALGKTKNNLGYGTVVLSSKKRSNLTNGGANASLINEHKVFKNETNVVKGTSTQKILEKDGVKNKVHVTTDPNTSEFVAYLLPEEYVVDSVIVRGVPGNTNSASDYVFSNDKLPGTIDLRSSYLVKTSRDTVLSSNPSVSLYDIDSTHYHKNIDFIYRVEPQISVTNKDDEAHFWPETIKVSNTESISVVDENKNPLAQNGDLAYPIFQQMNKYDLKIKVSEDYIDLRASADPKTDKVPVSDGVIEIVNALSIDGSTTEYPLNKSGIVNYSFRAGLPNISSVQDESLYRKSMSIIAKTGEGGLNTAQWKYQNTFPFYGYILGSQAKGTDFITNGPLDVIMILRDPHGSNSYSYLEKGTTIIKTESWDTLAGFTGEADLELSFGQKVITYAGSPVGGVISEAENTLDVNAGVSITSNVTNNKTTESTYTTTERWETSSDPAFVGYLGDVIIGKSTNMVYGEADKITLLPYDENDQNQIRIGISNWAIGKKKTIRINKAFGTGFNYTVSHIENKLIPNLKKLRNEYLKNSAFHTSLITDTEDENYGKPNTNVLNNTIQNLNAPNGDTLSFTEKYTGGDSYEITIKRTKDSELSQDFENGHFPITEEIFDTDNSTESNKVMKKIPKLFIDSVQWYNDAISRWEEVLRQNEEDKLTKEVEKNVSFDAGSIYTSEIETNNAITKTKITEFTMNPYVGGAIGGEFQGMGVKVSFKATQNNTKTSTEGVQTTSSKTIGYVLEDGDDGDYYSIDIKECPSGMGPIFSVRGGQSQCPYQDEERTKYVTPEQTISGSTQQREKPVITCDIPSLVNVPSDKPANFSVDLKNDSESGDGGWYMIAVDDSTSQGAIITMDGTPIGNGRLVYIDPNVVLNKIISLRKPEGSSIESFNGIKIFFKSTCDADPSDNWPDIQSSIELSASFIPVCTAVRIKKPNDLWILNAANSAKELDMEIDGFNLNHGGFKYIDVEYKRTVESVFKRSHRFYVDNQEYAELESTDNASSIEGNAVVSYSLPMSSLQDGGYNIRVRSVCGTAVNPIYNYSEIITGIKDVAKPKVFGTPQPNDGILNPGDDIKITFNENIQGALLSKIGNFTVKGIVNDTKLDHVSALKFSDNKYASNSIGVDLSKKSFTVEFWIKRIDTESGVIFNQGDFSIGFNESNKLYLQFKEDKYLSGTEFNFTDEFIHVAATYNYANKKANLYYAYGTNHDEGTKGIHGAVVNRDFVVEGKMLLGNNKELNNGVNAFIHELRIWSKELNVNQIAAGKFTNYKGDEFKLVGYYPLNELEGELAYDLSRAHHLTLSGAEWLTFPLGYSYQFNGTNQLILPTQGVSAKSDQDLTIEFWFKGETLNNTNKIMFQAAPEEGAFEWKIGFNENNKLYFNNNGNEVVVDDKNYLDNNWHHLALIVNRKSNATIMLDGDKKKFIPSNTVGPFLVTSCYLSGDKDGNNQFTGFMDEIRIWKVAKTEKLLSLYKHAKLIGDEVGLLAYYPFEKMNGITDEVTSNLKNYRIFTSNATDSIATVKQGGVQVFSNTETPLITYPRPVQDLSFDFVYNDNEIIINILEEDAIVEKCIAEISVNSVLDLNNNMIASPSVWTAFIRKNTMLWDESNLSFEKLVYEPLSFTVDIKNVGGVEQGYTISNLPTWLTVPEPEGAMDPSSHTTLTFEVSEGLNIGNYEESLYLTGDFGFNEVIQISLKVRGEEPNWNFNFSDFAYNMSVIGLVKVDNVESIDVEDKLIAIVNNQIRGIANLEYISQNDTYLAMLDVYTNDTTFSESIAFNVWDASKGKVHTEVTPNLSFVKDTLYGRPTSPIIFNARNFIASDIVLSKGWNWISFPVKPDTDKFTIDYLFKDVNNTGVGDGIKTQKMVSQNNVKMLFNNYDIITKSWSGADITQLDNKLLYKVKISGDDTIRLNGAELDAINMPIDLVKGWNWIGFLASSNMEIADAFANYNVANNDILKSQNGFAVYDENTGWLGSLKHLEPTKGYMFYTSIENPAQLIYPDVQILYKNNFNSELQNLYAEYGIEPKGYESNMSLVARVTLCDNQQQKFKLIAYQNDEAKGAGLMEDGLFYLTLFGKPNNEPFSFKLVDELGNSYRLDEVVDYTPNQLLGKPSSPFVFTSKELLKVHGDYNNQITVIPTMYLDQLQVVFNLEEPTHVAIEIYDVTGRLLSTISDASFEKGNHIIKWQSIESNTSLPSGLHVLQVRFNNSLVSTKRLIHIAKK